MAATFKKIYIIILKALGLPFIILIQTYQYCISPVLGPRCRFEPTCSQYAIEAIKKHHIFVGFFLSCKRILKCHPLHQGGYDPVPQNNRQVKKYGL